MISVMSALALASCTPKNVAYLQNIDDTITTVDALSTQIRVKPEDKISIVVHSKDDQLSKLFNLPVVSTNITQAMTTTEATTIRNDGGVKSGMSVYTVSPEGTIQFQILGELKVAGMSRSELSGFIKGELMGRDLVKDPTVTVEFVNTGINVLGEVNSPGRIEVNRDHLTILDALAIAGDMTIHGQRENVMVIREENGQRKAYRIDMTDARKTMSSPAYYLQQNDIVMISPNRYKAATAEINQNRTFWLSITSTVISLATLIVTITR